MTDWELQDLAVQVVRDQLAQEGRELMSWNGNPGVNPSLWFVGDDGPEWVVVRAVRYPESEARLPGNIAELRAHFNKLEHPGHFASVGVASVDDPFDHKHRHVADKGVPYEFKDANQLLQDFFNEVDAVLKEVRSR